MSKWSKKVAGDTPGNPHLLALHQTKQDQYTNNNREKNENTSREILS